MSILKYLQEALLSEYRENDITKIDSSMKYNIPEMIINTEDDLDEHEKYKSNVYTSFKRYIITDGERKGHWVYGLDLYQLTGDNIFKTTIDNPIIEDRNGVVNDRIVMLFEEKGNSTTGSYYPEYGIIIIRYDGIDFVDISNPREAWDLLYENIQNSDIGHVITHELNHYYNNKLTDGKSLKGVFRVTPEMEKLFNRSEIMAIHSNNADEINSDFITAMSKLNLSKDFNSIKNSLPRAYGEDEFYRLTPANKKKLFSRAYVLWDNMRNNKPKKDGSWDNFKMTPQMFKTWMGEQDKSKVFTTPPEDGIVRLYASSFSNVESIGMFDSEHNVLMIDNNYSPDKYEFIPGEREHRLNGEEE